MLSDMPPSSGCSRRSEIERERAQAIREAEEFLLAQRSDIGRMISKLTEINSNEQTLQHLGEIFQMMNIGEHQLHIKTLDRNTSTIAAAPTESICKKDGDPGTAVLCLPDGSKEYETRVTVGSTTLIITGARKLPAQAEHETRVLARVAALQIEMNASTPVTRGQSKDLVEGASDASALKTHQDYRLKLKQDIARLAKSPFNVLVTGETGTGKTTIARLIHAQSARAGEQFIEFNCAALPEHLAEAELFGYRKGAFTGATADHAGLFEAAIGGTLFLDEVGELSLAIQSKLLKAIDERKVRRLGENCDRECDVRIIAATARNLKGMMRESNFREDLYYRLATLNLQTLPLHERRAEIPGLINFFLAEAAREQAKLTGAPPAFSIESRGVELLCGFAWTGNIRMLRNTVLELTSYVTDDEPITGEAVRAHLMHLAEHHFSDDGTEGIVPAPGTLKTAASARDVLAAFGIALEDGDMIVPLEACVVRRKETLDQWQDRAMVSCIDAARIEHGRWASAADRLGMVDISLQHRRRNAAKRLAGR